MQPHLERTTTTAISSSIRTPLFLFLVVCLFSVSVELSFAQDAGQIHVVRPGENLSTIARSYGVSLSALTQANGISNPDLVRVGQVLVIPGGAPQATEARPTSTPAPQSDTTRPSSAPSAQYIPQVQSNPAPVASANDVLHTVYPGESLSSIARRFGTTVSAIMTRNRLPSSLIYSGQRLIIPAGVRPAAQDVVPTTPVEPSTDATAAPTRIATPKVTSTPTPTPTRTVPSMLLLPTADATPTPARR